MIGISELIKVGLIFGLIYLIYKSGLPQKVLNKMNKFLNITKEYQAETKQRKRFIKAVIKQRRNNDEI